MTFKEQIKEYLKDKIVFKSAYVNGENCISKDKVASDLAKLQGEVIAEGIVKSKYCGGLEITVGDKRLEDIKNDLTEAILKNKGEQIKIILEVESERWF